MPPLLRMLPLLVASWMGACDGPPRTVAVPSGRDVGAELLAATGLPRFPVDAPLEVVEGVPLAQPGYTVRPVSFAAARDFRASAALWRPDGEGPFPGVLVVPGHFGEGKSAGECQEVAHALAARGVAALAVDVPGLEEWDVPGRQIHFEAGAHNRAVLAAAGVSALGLQLHVLRRGLAAFRELVPLERVAATGASGGAILSFYLLFAEPDLAGAALVSFVPLPREARAGGCPCDTVPGWPGPDPLVRAAVRQPTLWLSEIPQPRPDGLPANARFQVVPGPHSYTRDHRGVALPWLDDLLDHRVRDRAEAARVLANPPYVPSEALRSPVMEGARTVFDLAQELGTDRPWTPRIRDDVPYELDCRGSGPVVVVAGGGRPDRDAIVGAGLRACALSVPEDEVGLAEAIATGGAWADRYASAVAVAARRTEAVGAWGAGAWAVPVAASGVPCVLRDPILRLDQVDPARDPAWVHVPGGWWGGLERLYATARSTGSDPATLAAMLARMAQPGNPG